MANDWDMNVLITTKSAVRRKFRGCIDVNENELNRGKEREERE